MRPLLNILFIGKRFYTNRDALKEKYGRIYQLPWHWSQAGIPTKLWLIDYHTRTAHRLRDDNLEVHSTPVRSLTILQHWCSSGGFKPSQPFDMVIASGDCYIGWMAYFLARRMKAKFVFDVYDKYDEFAGYRSPPGFNLFTQLLDKAHARLFASRALMESLRRAPHDCLALNGLDIHRFAPRDMQKSRQTMNLPPNTLLVGYFGGMEQDRGIVDLIAAVTLLRKQGMEIQLVLGGKPSLDLNLQQPGVLYLGNVPYEKMPDALAACDLLAIPYRRSAFMDAGSSNKIAEAIACQRPIVATRTPNLIANFPDQARRLSPLLAAPGDPESLAQSIRLQSQQRLLVDMPDRMTWQHIAQDLAQKLAHKGEWNSST